MRKYFIVLRPWQWTKNLLIFIISIFIFSNNVISEEEPADIWNIEKKAEENTSISITDNDDSFENNIGIENEELGSQINIIDSNEFNSDLAYWTLTLSHLVDMDASDTAVARIFQESGASQTDINANSFFSGYLVC